MALRTPLSVTPHLYMGDSTGRPLDKGVVYFGEQDKDPEFYPINLFSDDALTLPLAQPVHTKGGYLYDKGDMVEPHAKELIYSVKVLDSYGRKVFYKGAMLRNSWNDDVIDQINTAIIGSADVARQVATDITNDAINNTAVEGGVLADTFVTMTANGAGTVARNLRDYSSDRPSVRSYTNLNTAAIKADNVLHLNGDILDTGVRNTFSAKNIVGGGAKIKQSGDHIAVMSQRVDNFTLRDVTVDGQGNGQKDAGLIVLSESKDFVIDNITLLNGGTVGELSPAGVNGIGVATENYPTGAKSTGNISRVRSYNFTKAPINWTTFAEEGTLTFSNFYDNVGNGFTPGMQVNGGKRLKALANNVFRTEGAGTAIGTVGTVPPLAASDCMFAYNSYYDVGTLGLANAEEHAFNISDGTGGAYPVKDIFISNEVLQRAKGGFLRTSYSSNILVNNCYSYATFGVYRLLNCSNISISNHIARDFNSPNLTSIAAYELSNANAVNITGGELSSTSSLAYLLKGVGSNADIDIRGVMLLDKQIGIIPSSDWGNFKNTKIEISRSVKLEAGETYNLFTAVLPDAKSLHCKISAVSITSSTVYCNQTHESLSHVTNGTLNQIKNEYIVDSKLGVVGLTTDKPAANAIRYRVSNTSSAAMTFNLKMQFFID